MSANVRKTFGEKVNSVLQAPLSGTGRTSLHPAPPFLHEARGGSHCPPFGRALIRQGLFLHKTFKEDSQQNPYKSTFLGKVFSIQLVKIVLLLVLGCHKEKLYIIIIIL